MRSCARVGCGEAATSTLTADYEGRVMAVGPLSPERTPPALDLCGRHREALAPPEGWSLLRHEPGAQAESRDGAAEASAPNGSEPLR